MKAIIANFRRGKHRQNTRQAILSVEGVDSKDKATKLVGKKVTYVASPKTSIVGSVSAAHGNSGAVRVIFERGIPGQALGKQVKLE